MRSGKWEVFVLVLCGTAALAQQGITDTLPRFEVASIKPTLTRNDGTGAPACRIWGKNTPIKFLQCYPLTDLIQLAYGVRDFQVSGGPGWVATDFFVVEATAERPVTNAKMMQMLAALLADRFQLAFHRETRTVQVYAIVTAKGGAKLGSHFHPAKQAKQDEPPPTGGDFRWRTSMTQFAKIVTQYLRYPLPNSDGSVDEFKGLPVIDQTGLVGDYDIVMTLEPGHNWFSMLQSQLGLKLESRRAPFEIIVIDRAVKPSPN